MRTWNYVYIEMVQTTEGGWPSGSGYKDMIWNRLTINFLWKFRIGAYLHEGVQFSLEVQAKSGKKLVDFMKALKEPDNVAKLNDMKAKVEAWAGKFFMPGH